MKGYSYWLQFQHYNLPMKLKVKQEHRPTRCEVCHQSDCFDAKDNYCSRCDSIFQLDKNPKKSITISDQINTLAINFYRNKIYPRHTTLIDITGWGIILSVCGYLFYKFGIIIYPWVLIVLLIIAVIRRLIDKIGQ